MDDDICLCPADVLIEKGCQCDEQPEAACDLSNPETCESCQ